MTDPYEFCDNGGKPMMTNHKATTTMDLGNESIASTCSLEVAITGEGSNSRIEIKVAHQSFSLEYCNDEQGAMEWFAGNVRSALKKAGANVKENDQVELPPKGSSESKKGVIGG